MKKLMITLMLLGSIAIGGVSFGACGGGGDTEQTTEQTTPTENTTPAADASAGE